jgi:phosphohistidine swiveling domain-containing protein
MPRLLTSGILLATATVALAVGLVDAAVSAEWDLFAVFVIATLPIVLLAARRQGHRRDHTVRADLDRWVTNHVQRTGERPEVVVDRAIASYRGRVDPAGGHTAVLRSSRAPASTSPEPAAGSEDDPEGRLSRHTSGATLVLTGDGAPGAVVGGKAAALDALVAGGHPVPPTGVVTTHAYRRFVAETGLEELLGELRERGAPDGAHAAAERERVENAFLEATFPHDLRAEILDLAHRVQGDGRLAVRSSATAEDQAGASFAGQYASFLELEDDEEVLTAVKRVWASLWGPEVRTYRAHRDVDEDAIAMGVVVMRLVEAERAGVLFTEDPGGATGQLRLEVVDGLAEGLVSGEETPDAHVIDRDPATRVLDDPVLAALVDLGLAVEADRGAPQDIEWAHDGDRLWLVQSRPITVAAGAAADDDGFDTPICGDDEYTSAGVAEMLPGVLSPLVWSIDGPLLDQAFHEMFDELRILPAAPEHEQPGPTPSRAMVGRFRGRAALNLSALKESAARMPGGAGAELERQYFGTQVSAPSEDEPAGGLVVRLRALPGTVRALRMRRRLASDSEIVIAAVERLVGLEIDVHGLDDAHLLAYWRRVAVLAARTVSAQVGVAAAAAATYRGLEMFLQQHLGGEDGSSLAQALTSGDSHPCGIETSLAVCDLVRDALGDEQLRRELAQGIDEGSEERLAASPAGRLFLAEFRARLRQAGSSAVFAGATWDEDRDAAWNLLHQAVMVELADRRPTRRTGRDRAALLADVESRIGGGWRWRLQRVFTGQIVDVRLRMLRRLTADAADFLQRRERTKLSVLRLGGVARRIVVEMADRLVVRGTLGSREQVEHLAITELEEAIAGAAVRRDVLDRRRRALSAARQAGALPRRFDSRPEPESLTDVVSGDRLRGWAASAGRHRGTVRLVHDVAGARLDDGDVLVARSTDPSWTPLFLRAGAIVVEEGGPLSHAAIVARELGLPAVLNVPGATRALQDGQEVTVDGSAGTIDVHDGAADHPAPATASAEPATAEPATAASHDRTEVPA